MSRIRTASVRKYVAAQPNPTAASPAAPVLITEQQVLFSTAAAVTPPRPRYLLGGAPRAFSSAMTWWRTRGERRAERPHYPARMNFLEDSLMSREMDRL
jgi:hypothetical protein